MDPDHTATLAKALSHPDRLRFLAGLEAAGELSPRAFAERSGVPLGTVSYHVRTLRGAGLVRQSRTAQRRGAIEHFYVLTPLGSAVLGWARSAPGRHG